MSHDPDSMPLLTELDAQDADLQDLTQRMEQVRNLLTKQAWLTRKKVGQRVVFSIRYWERLGNGQTVQRALTVGSDPRHVEHARQLLDKFQTVENFVREARAAMRVVCSLERLANRRPKSR